MEVRDGVDDPGSPMSHSHTSHKGALALPLPQDTQKLAHNSVATSKRVDNVPNSRHNKVNAITSQFSQAARDYFPGPTGPQLVPRGDCTSPTVRKHDAIGTSPNLACGRLLGRLCVWPLVLPYLFMRPLGLDVLAWR